MSDSALALLDALPADDRRIAQVLSVVYEPITQGNLLAILRQLGWRGEDGKLLSGRLHKTWRVPLITAGVLFDSRELRVVPECAEHLSRELVREGVFDQVRAVCETIFSSRQHYVGQSQTPERFTRRLRAALYTGNENEVLRLLKLEDWSGTTPVELKTIEPLVRLCTQPRDDDWFVTLPELLQLLVLTPQLANLAGQLRTDAELDALAQRVLPPLVARHPLALTTLAQQQLLRGQFTQAAALLSSQISTAALPLIGWLHAVNGRRDESLGTFELYLKTVRRETRRRTIPISGLAGVLYLLQLLSRGTSDDLKQFNQHLSIELRYLHDERFDAAQLLLFEFSAIRNGTLSYEQASALHTIRLTKRPFNQLFHGLVLHWLGERPHDQFLVALDRHVRTALEAGWLWYAWEAHALLDRLGRPMKNIALPAPPEGSERLVDWMRSRARWELALDALTNLGSGEQTNAEAVAERRLIWLLHQDADGSVQLEPREQKRTKSGGWTAGRAVALQRLRESPHEFEGLTDADRRLCNCIQRDYELNWYGQVNYSLDQDAALAAAVGHPRLFRPSNLERPVELVSSGPALTVTEGNGTIQIQLQPFPPPSGQTLLLEEGQQRLRVVRFDATHQRIATILTPNGLQVPPEAQERVLASIAAVAPRLTVHSAIGGTEQVAETLAADPRPYLHLQPLGDGLSVELFMQPLGEHGPRLHPGQGLETIFAELDGRAVQTRRSLAAETAQVQTLIAACPSLVGQSGWSWVLADTETALTALAELYALGDDIVLLWPEGKRIGLTRELGLGSMSVQVGSGQDWLGLEGRLTLDDGRVLEMQLVLELLDAQSGRFVSIGEREFMVLSDALRQRLETLRDLTDDGGRFHPLAASAIDDALTGMQVEHSAAWQDLLQRLADARDFEPTLPSTLQAELRDYQLEGFRWLARLAHLGAGACLADDMGLGKTLQALALILTRAPEGPTLVLAPMSVCSNWSNEARRFAPTLQLKRFGEGDREQMLQDAGPFDLIVCSYGLVQTEGERLATVQWATIVADEAQAFKNAQTKRSQAMMKLHAGFKLITTGTPIENHLGELWNLFRFINPGLLGSLEQFNQRFAIPIEQQRDSRARSRLRQLLKPFILRRLKSDVLTELPPRTEMTLELELGAAEAAFYEAMRRQALERLESDEASGPGQKRIQLLAEIMRLRRACCHPQLVMPNSDLGSAKLEAFGDILDELLENKHKALVFSQFVDHLSLIRAYLDARGIVYQYLDGSTPEAKRKAAVAAFQAGQGDIFLISLRAGGAGLNLTAADYVIHMDPWWNPAVEDQASDRAHRIGQERPVTIYRLVTKGTIEEKILALHSHKRELADGLLEGTGDGGRLSYDEMLGLIQAVD